MLSEIGDRARRWAQSNNPWTNVYGVGRTLLALSTLITLLFTHTAYLFTPGSGMPRGAMCAGAPGLGAFCLAGEHHLEVARWVAILALAVIASGWRPRITAPLHWWIAFSVANNASVVDGGDQVILVLTTLLLPVALTDRRAWHWGAPEPVMSPLTGAEEARRLIALFALVLIRIQVAGIYFHAAIGKFGVEEWVDGTAVYYYFQDPSFGAGGIVMTVLRPILQSAVGVCAISWGTLVLEYLLSAALFMPKRRWRPLLIAGIALHTGIIMVHGLVSFSLAMFAALILYLRPREAPLELATLRSWARASKTVVVAKHPNQVAAL
jgi:antimicrobial peptide system SdpB family protein